MNLKYIFLISLISIISFTGNLSAENITLSDRVAITQNTNDDIITHTVAKGETVYSIAALYHTSVKEIYKLNPNAEKGIKTGDQLKIKRIKRKASGYSNHLIEAKETFYSVARMYNISVEDIKVANPGLSETTFNIGKTIRIPSYNSTSIEEPTADENTENIAPGTYKVKKGETLYSIGRTYHVSVENLLKANPHVREQGLREGSTIIIPTAQTANDATTTVTVETQEMLTGETPYARRGENVNVGILLPFADEKGTVQKSKLLEYYDGFLLAVKHLKEKGLNAEIYTFDIGTENDTKKLESLLGTNEIVNMHLILGGVSKKQVDLLADFSKNTGIKYVMPFATTEKINTNSNIFQLNTSNASLLSDISSAFISRFKEYNVIFVAEAGTDNNKTLITNQLKKDLTQAGIQHYTTMGTSQLTNDIQNLIDPNKKNVLIPTSSSSATLIRLFAALKPVIDPQITLFGYPEWQTYSVYKANFHKYDTYIYSTFFLNPQQKEVVELNNEYNQWYQRNMAELYPKWGFLGYDTGLYFLTALKNYGSTFDSHVSSIKAPTLQTAIDFYRINDQGGYINKGMYFVHYKTDLSIEKTDISK